MSAELRVMEDRPCPLGCLGPDEPVLRARDRINHRPGEFAVVRCTQCGLMRTNPRPAPSSMEEFYPADYGPYRGTTPNQGNRLRLAGLRTLYRRFFPTFASALPPVSPGAALEIGCASGRFLSELRELGWHCHGVEFSPSASSMARSVGHDVYCETVENMPDDGRRYDLIVGWMVLEHLHEPVRALQKLARIARPDGLLALSVPNAGSADFLVFGSAGYALHLPNHLYHFTPESLDKVLKAGGWQMYRVHHHRTLSNWVGALGNKLEDAGWPRWLSGPLKSFPESFGFGTLAAYPLATLLAAIGATGRMTVWARLSELPPE